MISQQNTHGTLPDHSWLHLHIGFLSNVDKINRLRISRTPCLHSFSSEPHNTFLSRTGCSELVSKLFIYFFN